MTLLPTRFGKALVLAFLIPAFCQGFCYEEAGAKYGIDPLLLRAMALTESSENPNAVSKANKDGSRDHSLMQINEWWFDKLERYGVTKEDLKNPCQSVHAGAWVLAQAIQSAGNNWRAVGIYNAGPSKKNEEKRKQYVSRVWKHYQKLVTVNK